MNPAGYSRMTKTVEEKNTVHNRPDFIVIGAMKAGTTSLHQYLDAHPDIAMAPKELNFFGEGNVNHGKGLKWYARHFAQDNFIQGEVSPSYSKTESFPTVVREIHSYAPNVRLIYVLREPSQRIISHLSHAIGADASKRSARQILEDDLDHFVSVSKYSLHIARYLELFDRDRLLIVTAENLKRDRDETLRTIFRFIGANENFESPVFSQIKHDSSLKVRRNWLGRQITKTRFLSRGEALAKKVIPNRFHRAFSGLLGTTFQKPILPEDLRQSVDRQLEGEIERLRSITEYDFDEWRED